MPFYLCLFIGHLGYFQFFLLCISSTSMSIFMHKYFIELFSVVILLEPNMSKQNSFIS